MTYLFVAIAAIAGVVIWILRAKYDPEIQKQKIEKERRARLNQLNREIDDAKKELGDAINIKDNAAVNRLSAVLAGLSAERNRLEAELSGKL